MRAHEIGRELTGADHQQRLCVASRKVVGGECRVGRGFPPRERGTVEQQARRTVAAVEQRIDALDGRCIAVARKRGDELNAQGLPWRLGRQHEQCIVPLLHHQSLRPRRRGAMPGAQVLDQRAPVHHARDRRGVDELQSLMPTLRPS
jgi:hypothetical protein